MTKVKTRSPLREAPLRLPGQFIQDEIDRVFENRVIFPIIITGGFISLALADWVRYFSTKPLNPWLSSVVALGALGYSALSVTHATKRVRILKLGRDGERVVAEQMDKLKQHGAAVIHDVVAGKFNIDHVILSPKGVFVAETKTRSKPQRGSPTVTYDGKVLLVNGLKPDRDPIAQAQGCARWIAEKLKESTGKSFPVKPVVLFPGWFVEPTPHGSSVWVLEPKALPSFIENEPTIISDEDLHLAVYHMNRIVRPQVQ